MNTNELFTFLAALIKLLLIVALAFLIVFAYLNKWSTNSIILLSVAFIIMYLHIKFQYIQEYLALIMCRRFK